MEKLAKMKIVPAYMKTLDNHKFYKRHISGEDSKQKYTNHIGNFHEVNYHKILDKKIKKTTQNKIRKLSLKQGQDSFIAKNVTVREFGNHKAGIKEQNLCFEVAGRDGNAGGVIPEHLHRHFWNLNFQKGTVEGTELATCQGGSEYILEEAGKPYEGYYKEAMAEEARSDLNLFLDGDDNWMDNEEDMDWNPQISLRFQKSEKAEKKKKT